MQLESWECAFTFKIDTHVVIISVYVDKFIILGPKLSKVKRARKEIMSLFKLTDLRS